MCKIYLSALLLCCTGFLKAQTACDTVNMPVPQNWTSNCYEETTFFPGVINGYISGVNADNYTQQADYFDLSATPYAYIAGTVIKFSKANSNVPDNLSKLLYFRVFADNNGVPGAEITTSQTLAQVSLNQVKSDVAAGNNTNINFPSAIALPASKKFYVAVDMSNFQWSPSDGIRDSICITATGDNETANIAWNYDADVTKWKSYTKVWDAPPDEIEPLDVSLYIFPYVSTTASSCALLPVKLLSFEAVQNNRDVILNWQVSNELNMKGYEIEKAGSNGVFTAVKYVPAVNSVKNQTYSATDANAFAGNNIIQYRLKQINTDGSVQYSKIVIVKADGAGISFQNPFSGALKLQLNLSASQAISATIYDAQGRLVAVEKTILCNTGVNSINFNSTLGLKTGTYVLKLVVGDEQFSYKIIKQ